MVESPIEQLPLTRLQGVGPGLQKKLQQLGMQHVQDLLFHLPLRYEDRTRIHPIVPVRLGSRVQLQGEIVSSTIQSGRRRSLLCVLSDDSGSISLRFFHFSARQQKSLAAGTLIRCYGEVRKGPTGMEIYHPEYQVLQAGGQTPLPDALTAIYPTTEGLHQNRLRKLVEQALDLLERQQELVDYLPPAVVQRFSLPSLTEAIKQSHRPPADTASVWLATGTNPARQRLAFEELLAHRLCMRRHKRSTEQQLAPALTGNGQLANQLLAGLGFELTRAQRRVSAEIHRDLASPRPMLRLLQGDVGSGKTVVAALAALAAIHGGYQVALMAPTEILAEQHWLNFQQWMQPLGIQVGWLSGKTRSTARKSTLAALASGEIRLIIGTHALFQDKVDYHRLGLVIIDEQHRFGVHQRLTLRSKGDAANRSPHQLVMTATPIPRTLAMTAYADLDCSVIDEAPPGRKPVNTLLRPSDKREKIIRRIEWQCKAGNQAYWVCTLIEESETLQAQAAETTAQQLAAQLPDIKVGLIHGRLKTEQKQQVMQRFKQNEIQLLVATTVIEVGVDVPNAGLMVIENPERLGLVQLHQLRGRIGRSSRKSYCVLLYQSPLSETAEQRLEVLMDSKDSNNGFYIAEKDLELRGAGQVLGTEQTGLATFRVADLTRDAALLDNVKLASEQIMQQAPEAIEPLVQRWIGDRLDFINV